MAEHETERMERLDRYWDAVVKGTPTGAQPPNDRDVESLPVHGAPDRADTATIRYLHESRVPTPTVDPAFAARLWSHLVAQSDSALDSGPRRPVTPVRSKPLGRPARKWIAALVAGGALIGGSVIAYVSDQGPAPVSAQTIMQRAANVLAARPNRVIHEIWVGSGPGATTFKSESWTQLDSGGRLVRSAFSDFANNRAVTRGVRTLTTDRHYERANNIVVMATRAPSPCDAAPFQKSWQDQYRRLLLSEQVLNPRQVRRQMHDGHDVYVLDLSSPPKIPASWQKIVWYIDAHNYMLRGIDEITLSPLGRVTRAVHARLTRYESVPISAVRAQVFQLHAPMGARVKHLVNPPTECDATIPQLLSLSRQPIVVLAGHPLGLHLTMLGLNNSPCSGQLPKVVPGGTWIQYNYVQLKPRQRAFSPGLCLAISYATARSVNVTVPVRLARSIKITSPSQIIRLRIAGQTVSAHFEAISEPYNMHVQVLWYLMGRRAFVFEGYQMDRRAIFGVVVALVDGRTHPATAASVQRDLGPFTH